MTDHWHTIGVVLLIALCALLINVLAVRGEEPHDHSKMGAAGEFYAKWNIPKGEEPRTSSCCNMHDCYATAIKNIGGTWFGQHRETGRWIVIPDNRLEELQPDERESPDGQSHMCAIPMGLFTAQSEEMASDAACRMVHGRSAADLFRRRAWMGRWQSTGQRSQSTRLVALVTFGHHWIMPADDLWMLDCGDWLA